MRQTFRRILYRMRLIFWRIIRFPMLPAHISADFPENFVLSPTKSVLSASCRGNQWEKFNLGGWGEGAENGGSAINNP
ncbi:hypothetical protein KFK09_004431 [Dendrobium nobile]|uniref:Uncharacterized protein n=1 Tax=Dendrobium nobile TaxID=94219 RepID=A0A8T3C629_DENNO|nr:hypothetical protein KFK09_004431 [Dendrobium nobile]